VNLSLPYDGASSLVDEAGETVIECATPELARRVLAEIEDAARLRAILALIDRQAGPADHTCDEPGITLSEAARRTLRNEGHPLFRKEPRP
jgi:hypothetical protein